MKAVSSNEERRIQRTSEIDRTVAINRLLGEVSISTFMGDIVVEAPDHEFGTPTNPTLKSRDRLNDSFQSQRQ